MKAVRWHGRGDVRVEEIASPPTPAANEVQIAVLACGICGTDVEEYRAGPLFVSAEPHPLTGSQAPLVLGHEFAGRVVAVGPGVEEVRLGDLVAIAPDLSCGSCRWCRAGRPNLCPLLASIGLAGDGGLAELCNVPARQAVPLPAHVAAEAAAIIETAAVAMAAIRRGRGHSSDRVVVVGGGTVGLMTVQAARAMGVAEVVLIEPIDARRRLGRSFGATAIAPGDTDGVRGDLVIECSGAPAGIAGALAAADRGARVVIVGVHERPAVLDALAVVTRELELLGSLSYCFDDDYLPACRLVSSGDIDVLPLISARVGLDDAVEKGLLELAHRPEAHVKIVVMPQQGASEC